MGAVGQNSAVHGSSSANWRHMGAGSPECSPAKVCSQSLPLQPQVTSAGLRQHMGVETLKLIWDMQLKP